MTRRIILTAVATLHVAVLLIAVSPPCYAVVDTLFGLLDGPDAEQSASIVDAQRWSTLLGNTAVVCGVAMLTALGLGGFYGILAARTDLPGRSLLVGGAVLGACVPVYVSLVFVISFIPVGALTESAIACGLLYGLIYAPLATVVLGVAFRMVDRDLEEQALLDAGPGTVLLRVTLPQAGWGVATLGILVLLLVGTDYTITDILMVRTFAEEVYTQYALARTRAGPLITAAPVFVALAVLLVWLQVRYRLLGEGTPWQLGARPRVISLGRWRVPVALVCILLPTLLVGVPAHSLLRRIGSVDAFFGTARAVWSELSISASLAAAGGIIIAAAAVGLAWGAIRGRRLRGPICAAMVLLLASPAPVIGISLIGILNRPGWPGAICDSPAVIVIGYLVRFLPIGVLLLLPAVHRVPIELELAARIDGCDWLSAQRHVYWPAMARPIAVVWLVVVILCFTELGTTMLVVPPGWATASVRAFTLIHYGVYRDLAVLAVLSLASIVLPWALLVWSLKRWLARSTSIGSRSV